MLFAIFLLVLKCGNSAVCGVRVRTVRSAAAQCGCSLHKCIRDKPPCRSTPDRPLNWEVNRKWSLIFVYGSVEKLFQPQNDKVIHLGYKQMYLLQNSQVLLVIFFSAVVTVLVRHNIHLIKLLPDLIPIIINSMCQMYFQQSIHLFRTTVSRIPMIVWIHFEG